MEGFFFQEVFFRAVSEELDSPYIDFKEINEFHFNEDKTEDNHRNVSVGGLEPLSL